MIRRSSATLLLLVAAAHAPAEPRSERPPARPERSAEERAARAAQLRDAFSKPPAEWPKPHVDDGIEWREIGLLPPAAHPGDNPHSPAKGQLGKTLPASPVAGRSPAPPVTRPTRTSPPTTRRPSASASRSAAVTRRRCSTAPSARPSSGTAAPPRSRNRRSPPSPTRSRWATASRKPSPPSPPNRPRPSGWRRPSPTR